MLILVSGEGSTDIGKASGNYDLYAPGSWDPGPMAHFINCIIYNTLNFEPLDSMSMWFIPEEYFQASDCLRLALKYSFIFANDTRPRTRYLTKSATKCPTCTLLRTLWTVRALKYFITCLF